MFTTPPSQLQLSHAFTTPPPLQLQSTPTPTTPPLRCQSHHTPPTISPLLQPLYTTTSSTISPLLQPLYTATSPTTPPPLSTSLSVDVLTPTSENFFENERNSYFSDSSSDDEKGSDEEESREEEFDTFVQTARPPLAPFSHLRPPSNILHRVAKRVIREYPDWRHSTTDTMRGLRDYLRSLSWSRSREEGEWEECVNKWD
ncbi:1238_t:CDS:2 [Paraglomus brasilianum]|uniref:1238_t:CDS:1 n=1 Tax=Paraglomus brasilianum TaxID=144538 RepID=A0A9N9BMB2_9GLOM|nr:1238_t:CDS:2 [Paraglomus brasilianum]